MRKQYAPLSKGARPRPSQTDENTWAHERGVREFREFARLGRVLGWAGIETMGSPLQGSGKMGGRALIRGRWPISVNLKPCDFVPLYGLTRVESATIDSFADSAQLHGTCTGGPLYVQVKCFSVRRAHIAAVNSAPSHHISSLFSKTVGICPSYVSRVAMFIEKVYVGRRIACW